MMAKYKYVNTKTGASFESNALCDGGPWARVDDAVMEKALQAPEQEPEQEPEQDPEETPKKNTKARK